MPRKIINREPYKQSYYAPSPTKLTRHLRISLPWQIVRFVVINLKMLKLMARSHH